jgi:hypothetical protein
MFNDHFGVAAGASVYKFSDQPLATTGPKGNARIPLKASIEPNPVTNKLSIKIEFPESDHMRLELFDAAGDSSKNCNATPFKQPEPNITILIFLMRAVCIL